MTSFSARTQIAVLTARGRVTVIMTVAIIPMKKTAVSHVLLFIGKISITHNAVTSFTGIRGTVGEVK